MEHRGRDAAKESCFQCDKDHAFSCVLVHLLKYHVLLSRLAGRYIFIEYVLWMRHTCERQTGT